MTGRRVVRGALSAAVLAVLVIWIVMDLDTAGKVAGIVACVLALPAIWWATRPAPTGPVQRIMKVRAGGSILQRGTPGTQQRIDSAEVDGDIEQGQ